MPFQVFQAHCDERRFVYGGRPGSFHVMCKLGKPRCNKDVCPVWNSDRVQGVSGMSLRDVNLKLKNGPHGTEKARKVHARSG